MMKSDTKRNLSQRQRRQRRASRNSWQWHRWIIGVAVAVFVLGAIALLTRDSDVLAGEVVAEYTEYDFGAVPMGGGLISARFPLQAIDPAMIERIEST
jgi:hypothetical protein